MYPSALPLDDVKLFLDKFSGKPVSTPQLVAAAYDIEGFCLGQAFPLPPAPAPEPGAGAMAQEPSTDAFDMAEPPDAHEAWNDEQTAQKLQTVVSAMERHQRMQGGKNKAGLAEFKIPAWLGPLALKVLQEVLAALLAGGA